MPSHGFSKVEATIPKTRPLTKKFYLSYNKLSKMILAELKFLARRNTKMKNWAEVLPEKLKMIKMLVVVIFFEKF